MENWHLAHSLSILFIDDGGGGDGVLCSRNRSGTVMKQMPSIYKKMLSTMSEHSHANSHAYFPFPIKYYIYVPQGLKSIQVFVIVAITCAAFQTVIAVVSKLLLLIRNERKFIFCLLLAVFASNCPLFNPQYILRLYACMRTCV